MTPDDLASYLHDNIPLTAAMQIGVEEVDAGHVVLVAPLRPNVNHRHTMFGGSLASLGITAAWALLHVRLHAFDFEGELVVQRSTTDFLKPARGSARVVCEAPEAAEWTRFERTLRRRGRARIAMRAEVSSEDVLVAVTCGSYVALGRSSV